MKSFWDERRALSTYHFDPRRVDRQEDCIRYLGRLPNTWQDDLADIIKKSYSATWATRGYKAQQNPIPSLDLDRERHDISRVGADPDAAITNLNWELPSSLQDISAAFGLDDVMNRIHVQMPGQLWHLHIDKLEKWMPEDPSRVMRIMIQLTDWQPGQFWEFGNYHWNQWTAGDVVTFDWANMPHSTANAGHYPRVTLQITGIETDATKRYLEKISNLL